MLKSHQSQSSQSACFSATSSSYFPPPWHKSEFSTAARDARPAPRQYEYVRWNGARERRGESARRRVSSSLVTRVLRPRVRSDCSSGSPRARVSLSRRANDCERQDLSLPVTLFAQLHKLRSSSFAREDKNEERKFSPKGGVGPALTSCFYLGGREREKEKRGGFGSRRWTRWSRARARST